MNPVELPTAGLHYGVPFETYQAWPAANFSKIKPIKDTASKCKWAMDHPKEMTPAMKLGSAMHIAVLEPARFETHFFIAPYWDGRTAEGKAIKAQAEKDAAGKLIIRTGSREDEALLGEVEKLRGMGKAVRASKAASQFLEGQGHNEVSMLWKDVEANIWCKARLDRYLPTFGKTEKQVIVEFKTCRSASEFWFGKDVADRDYDAQAAGYRHGLQLLTGKPVVHVMIAIENDAPFDLNTFVLDDAAQQAGALKYRKMITRFAECERSGQWPGYDDMVQTLSLPAYAVKDYSA